MEIWRRAAGLGTCRRHRGMELWRCAAGVGTSRYGDRELGRHVAGLGTWRCRGIKIGRCAAGVLRLRGMELWSSGGMLWARRCCLKRGLEMRCRLSYLPQELRRHAVGVEMSRYGGTSIRMARASRAEVVVVKSWLAPQLLPAPRLLPAIQLFLARNPAPA